MDEVGRKYNELIGGDLSMKMNIAGIEYEGSPQELKELFDLLGDNEAEESKEEYRKIVRSPRAGDYVKFNESDDDNITVGKYYEITAIDDDGDAVFIDDGGSVNWALKALFDEGEFEFFEKVAPDTEFEVGDYIVALSAADEEYFCTNTNMKLGKVIEICDGGYIKIEAVRHENYLYEGQTFEVDRRFFRKAYKEEVDIALPQYAIFTKLGRKPNEFKKGDIVRYVSDGEICEVIDVEKGIAKVKTNGYGICSETSPKIELIAPVESRVDI